MNNLLGSGLLQSIWPKTSDWLIKDEFTDTRAAGSVNGTAATPGPGTRTVTDTENKLSVGSGVMAFAGGKATPAWGDPSIWYPSQSRATGLCIVGKATSTQYFMVGLDANATTIATLSIFFAASSVLTVRISASSGVDVGVYSSGEPCTCAVIARSTGAIYAIKGSGYAQWTLVWISDTGSDANLRPVAQSFSAVTNFDYLRVVQLPAPFDTDDGIATDTKSGSVAAGTTFSHTADALLEFTVTTLGSADAHQFRFRKVNNTNYWYVYIGGGTGNFDLYEVVSGVPTSRGSVAGVVADGHRIVIVADGTTIKGYSNNVLRWTYSSATNFATATAGELITLSTGGAISDIKTWPCTLSGTASDILDKVSA